VVRSVPDGVAGDAFEVVVKDKTVGQSRAGRNQTAQNQNDEKESVAQSAMCCHEKGSGSAG